MIMENKIFEKNNKSMEKELSEEKSTIAKDLKGRYIKERNKFFDYKIFMVMLFNFMFFAIKFNVPEFYIFYCKFLSIIIIIIFTSLNDHMEKSDYIPYWHYFSLPLMTSSVELFLTGSRNLLLFFESINTVFIYSILYQKVKKYSYEKRLLADSVTEVWIKRLWKLDKKCDKSENILKIEEKNKKFRKILINSLISSKKNIKLNKVKSGINGIYSFRALEILPFLSIKKNLTRLFYNDIEKLNKLYEKNYKGKIIVYYENKNDIKIIFLKNNWLISEIMIYYDTGEIMCSCTKVKNKYAVDFVIYDKSENIIQKKNVKYQDFEFVGKNISNNFYIPYSIVTLCSLLGTDNIDEYIKKMNLKILI
ncbi:antitoxin component YwqK of YwqJK toxin-antitoxin module [Fusobacterium sp. PH5-29]